MLFHSFEFLFAFLPATLLLFYGLGAHDRRRVAVIALVSASLFFYGWWNPRYLILLVSSIAFNYGIGRLLQGRTRVASATGGRWILGLGVTGNLCALGYFKYTHFFLDSLRGALAVEIHVAEIALPLAISFFTFQQIAYLVDSYHGQVEASDFLHYCLFVAFFPQLIAGPIVHHREILPQITRRSFSSFRSRHLAVGASIFCIGLFKKVAIADGVAGFVPEVFESAEQGAAITLIPAWSAALAYSFQIYFDFSGYSDMAIGLARMFGVRLPLNFHSPYRATSIIEFWRRWHMTLSRFLRLYLYIPLGGNRRGSGRRYVNLMIVMLLGGMWHGASWTFVVWGGLHGLYLIANHGWRRLQTLAGRRASESTRAGRLAARALTTLAVVVAFVFFRADSIDGALHVLRGMLGLTGLSLPAEALGQLNAYFGLGSWLASHGWVFEGAWEDPPARLAVYLGLLLLVVWCLPSTQEFMARYGPALEHAYLRALPPRRRWWQWRPTPAFGAYLAALTALALATIWTGQEVAFLYFQF